jgi:hypothetical protein
MSESDNTSYDTLRTLLETCEMPPEPADPVRLPAVGDLIGLHCLPAPPGGSVAVWAPPNWWGCRV